MERASLCYVMSTYLRPSASIFKLVLVIAGFVMVL